MPDLMPCGTVAAYQRHLWHKETPCDECRTAARTYRREWTRAYRAKPESACQGQRCRNLAKIEGLCIRHYRQQQGVDGHWSLTEKIQDWLYVDGGWLTAIGIASDLGYNLESVERALRALRRDGVVESKVVELATSGRGTDSRMEWRTA